MKQLKIINPENVSEDEVKTYAVREAARAVVTDESGNVALLHVGDASYYKLPGGGIEGSEDPKIALERECQEEIGCNIEIVKEIGVITEYRKIFTLKQISYCYLAKVKGVKGTPHFTEEELARNFEAIWLPYQEALATLKGSDAKDFEGSGYIVPRDLVFLSEAGKYLDRT